MSDISGRLGIPDWEFRVVFGRTNIDYDPDKETINRSKHGFCLESGARHLERLILPIGPSAPHMRDGDFVDGSEVRHTHMGVDDSGKIVFFVTTMRPNETVRLISYRRASPEEREREG